MSKNLNASIICFILTILVMQDVHAQTLHQWQVTLKVVDETGHAIVGAETWVGYMFTNKLAGLTDSNGAFTASHTDSSFALVFFAGKSGYYPYREKFDMGYTSQYTPAKWNPTRTITLRQIGERIAMYAKKQELTVTKEGAPLGFDLMVGDWIAPYGKGNSSDIMFTVNRKIVNDHEYNANLMVTFHNKGDGIVLAPPARTNSSASDMLRTAAESGYNASLDLHYSNSLRPEPVPGYFIRVRTILDEKGQVKSALYGKIHGDFKFFAGAKAPHAGMGFTYYLNPAPNDRNVEFDPKKNLFKNLDSLEDIKEP